MAYDITSKTSPLNTEYEDSKHFNQAVQVAHDEAMFERQRRANQPSKYMQTLQAINSTLQTVNSGLQVAQNVNTMYDQITTNSFKRDQLEKQNRLKEQIQGAINENDWNKVATIAMANVSTASQMPEYMDTLGRMAKISGNEGSAALLRSVNTQQQGKLELEELKNLGKLQVAQENTRGKIAAANVSGQWSYKTGLTREQMKQAGEDKRALWGMANSNQQKLMEEEGKNYRADLGVYKEELGIASGKYSSGKGNVNEVQEFLANKVLKKGEPSSGTITPEQVPEATEGTEATEETPPVQVVQQGGSSPTYMNEFKQWTRSLLGPQEVENTTNKLQNIENSGNAPSKEAQAKAEANKQKTLQAQQTTNELVASFKNDELTSVMNNFSDAKGTSGGEKLNYALNNPEEFEFNFVTEPNKVQRIINGNDNKMGVTNLSDQYKDVIGVTQIREKKTGKVQNLYLNSDQAYKMNSLVNYNQEKVQMFNNAMKKKDVPSKQPVLTDKEKETRYNAVMNNPLAAKELASRYGIEGTPENIQKMAEYLSYNNPRASAQEVRQYVNSNVGMSVQGDLPEYGMDGGMSVDIPVDERLTKLQQREQELTEILSGNKNINDLKKREQEILSELHDIKDRDSKDSETLISATGMNEDLELFNIGKQDMVNSTDKKYSKQADKVTEEDAVQAFNKSIKKAVYTDYAKPLYNDYQKGFRKEEELILDPYTDITKLHPIALNKVRLTALTNLKKDYPDIYNIYTYGKNHDKNVLHEKTKKEAEQFRKQIQESARKASEQKRMFEDAFLK